MNSFRNRLLFWLVTLIVTVLIALGLLLGQLLKDFYAETMNKRMEKEAKALAILLENEPLERIRLDLKEMGDELSSRITVLDRHQRLQFDSGRIAAMEIMLNSPLIQDLIFKGEVAKIKEVMARSTRLGMRTFDQSLFELYETGFISYEDALRNADSKNELRLRIKLESKREPKELNDGGGLQIVEEDHGRSL